MPQAPIPVALGLPVPPDTLAAVAARAAAALPETSPAELHELLRRIEASYAPVRVWLFGSRARGDGRNDSDWDLLVVVDEDVPDDALAPGAAWHLQDGSGVCADVILYRASEFTAEVCFPNTLPFEAAREGRLLYAR